MSDKNRFKYWNKNWKRGMYVYLKPDVNKRGLFVVSPKFYQNKLYGIHTTSCINISLSVEIKMEGNK